MAWTPTRRSRTRIGGGWQPFLRWIGVTIEPDEDGEDCLTGIEGWAFEAITALQYVVPSHKDGMVFLEHYLHLAIIWDWAQRNLENLEAVEEIVAKVHGAAHYNDAGMLQSSRAALGRLGLWPNTLSELAAVLRRV